MVRGARPPARAGPPVVEEEIPRDATVQNRGPRMRNWNEVFAPCDGDDLPQKSADQFFAECHNNGFDLDQIKDEFMERGFAPFVEEMGAGWRIKFRIQVRCAIFHVVFSCTLVIF